MYCSQCGKEIPDDSRFCKYCGAPVVPLPEAAQSEDVVQPEEAARPVETARPEETAQPEEAAQPEETARPEEQGQPPKKGKKRPWVLLACLLCAAAVAVGLWYAFPRLTGSSDGFEAYYEPFSGEDVVMDAEIPYVDSQLLLTGTPDASFQDIESLVREHGGKIVGYISISNDYQITFPEGKDYAALESLAGELLENELVAEAMPHYVLEMSPAAVDYTADPWKDTDAPWDNSGSKWTEDKSDGLNWWAEAVNMPEVWQSDTQFEEVKVGVIDSMFDADHKDLKDAFVKLWNNPGDVVQQYEENWSLFPDEDFDIYYHGTHVAGIIAAKAGNGFGIAGVSQNAKLYGYANRGGPDRDLNVQAEADSIYQMKYAIALMLNEGVRVINNSQGYEEMLTGASSGDEKQLKLLSACSSSMERFLQSCLDGGYDFLIVKSAGNDHGCDAKYDYLGAIENTNIRDHILIVGDAENRTYFYTIANQSNTGSRVDIYAPGEDVLSDMPGDRTKRLSGTSMAAPIVTGAAALVWGANPKLSAVQVAYILKLSHTPSITEDEMRELFKTLEVNEGFADGTLFRARITPVIDVAAAVELALSRKAAGSGGSGGKETGILMGVAYCVLDSQTPELSEVTVNVYDAQGNSVRTAETGEVGGFSFALPAGDYRLEGTADGYVNASVELTVRAGEIVQQNLQLRPETSTGAVNVVDAYSYEGTATYSDSFSTREKPVEYRFPKVEIKGVSTADVNAELWPEDGSLIEWEYDAQGRRYSSLWDLMTYDWSVTGETLSILRIDRYEWGTLNYYAKNISVRTGQFMSDDEVLAQAGLSREAFYALAEDVLRQNYSAYLYQYWGGVDEQTVFEESILPLLDEAEPFFNAQGHLSMVAKGGPAGDRPHLFLFDLVTRELFELPQYRMVTLGTDETPDAPQDAVEVWDAFTYTGIFTDPNDSTYTEPVEYHIPQVYRGDEPMMAVNETLWRDLYENGIAQRGFLKNGEFYSGILRLRYEWYVNGDILSILVVEDWGPQDQRYDYEVYDISISSGELLSAAAFFESAGLSYDEYKADLTDQMTAYVNAFWKTDDASRLQALSATLTNENIAQSVPFLNEKGELCAKAALYYCYAVYESYDFLFNMTTEKMYGEQSWGFTTEDSDVTNAETPAEGYAGTWEVYDHIYHENTGQSYLYDQILFDPGTHQYIAAVNLLEAYGTVIGTYSENEQGEIQLKIEDKDFYGYSSDSATEFWLQRQGSILVPLERVWNLLPESTVFEYRGSITVAPDSGQGTVTGNNVRFRSAPSTDDLILFELFQGDTVTILGSTDGWYMVQYETEGLTAIGFMSSDYVEKDQ